MATAGAKWRRASGGALGVAPAAGGSPSGSSPGPRSARRAWAWAALPACPGGPRPLAGPSSRFARPSPAAGGKNKKTSTNPAVNSPGRGEREGERTNSERLRRPRVGCSAHE